MPTFRLWFFIGEIVEFLKVLGVFFPLDEHKKEDLKYKKILSEIKTFLKFLEANIKDSTIEGEHLFWIF